MIIFVVLEKELVEMDSCQSKVSTFAFDYFLTAFLHIFEDVWQFSKEVEQMPFEIVERLTVENSIVL